MIRVSVLYANNPGSKFDHDYYANSHLPMVRGKLGSAVIDSGIDTGIGSAAPGAPAPFVSIGWLTFNSLEDFQGAFESHLEEIMADIPQFTDIQPQFQISEIA